GVHRCASALPGRTLVTRIQTVEDGCHRLQQRIIILLQGAGAGHDGRKAGSLRDGNSADIQMMDERAEAGESGVLVQPEAGCEYLEGDFGIHVCEGGSIEVKAKRPLRAVLRTLQPQEPGLRIDEAPDEPCRGNTVDPQMLAGRPGAAAIRLAIELARLPV